MSTPRARISDPSPQAGEMYSTPLEDTFDGIRFEVGRMVQAVKDARKDPLVVDTARYIAERSSAWHEGTYGGARLPEAELKLLFLEGILYWLQESYFFVCDPTGIEYFQTPARMIRQYHTPREMLERFWNPIARRMSEARGGEGSATEMPDGRAIGDCEEGVTLALSLAVALDIAPVRFQFGGDQGTLHHVWAGAFANGDWHQFDPTQLAYGMGMDETLSFENYDHLDVEV